MRNLGIDVFIDPFKNFKVTILNPLLIRKKMIKNLKRKSFICS